MKNILQFIKNKIKEIKRKRVLRAVRTKCLIKEAEYMGVKTFIVRSTVKGYKAEKWVTSEANAVELLSAMRNDILNKNA